MRRNNVEDVYTLSPAQEGILFHSLYDSKSGVYISQISCTLKNLNVEALELAWQQAVDRHPILRTAFIWEKLRKPHQLVSREVKLPWDKRDWRSKSWPEQEEELEAFLAEDRRGGFTLGRPPLMRMSLFRLSEGSYQMIWTHHHLLLDGWSIFLVLKEVCRDYESLCLGRTAPPEKLCPFRDYINWLKQQDLSEAERYWRRLFDGVTSSATQEFDSRSGSEIERTEVYATQCLEISNESTADLLRLARGHHLTINTLVQGVWAMLLSHLHNKPDPVFGVTVSGRPAGLSGVESMVGLFINVLPLRVRITPDAHLLPWLTELQERQAEMRQYEYSPLSQIRKWAEISPSAPIFNSIVSFENYPVPVHTEVFPLEDVMKQQSKSIEIGNFRWVSKSNYPLTVIVGPRSGLSLRIVYSANCFGDDEIARLLSDFEKLLRHFVERPESKLREFADLLKAGKRDRQIIDQGAREKSIYARLKNVKPNPVRLPQGELIKTGFVDQKERTPLLMEPATECVDLSEWVKSRIDFVRAQAQQYGAILFRNFDLKSISDFERVVRALCPDLFGEYGDLPRESVGGKIYTSTPYPPDQTILFHNESSHLHSWPMKIAFFCVTAAMQGGETPIVDCRKAHDMLNLSVREKFRRKRVMYVRNYIAGLDVNWSAFFQTADRLKVEEYCRQHDVGFEWKENNGLKTWQVRDVITKHPKSNEMVFFNQLQLYHTSSIEKELLKSLLSLYREEDLPRQVYYGDGSPIEDSIMEEIGEIYREIAVSFCWQGGDLLLLDNMLAAHSRNSYVGDRKIVVAMGEMMSNRQIEEFGRK